jgi:hypothetical protein
MIRYDTELEELSYHKHPEVLRSEADIVIDAKDIHGGIGFERFFEAGGRMPPDCHCFWITWHGDNKSALLFFAQSQKDALDRVHALEGRESDL